MDVGGKEGVHDAPRTLPGFICSASRRKSPPRSYRVGCPMIQTPGFVIRGRNDSACDFTRSCCNFCTAIIVAIGLSTPAIGSYSYSDNGTEFTVLNGDLETGPEIQFLDHLGAAYETDFTIDTLPAGAFLHLDFYGSPYGVPRPSPSIFVNGISAGSLDPYLEPFFGLPPSNPDGLGPDPRVEPFLEITSLLHQGTNSFRIEAQSTTTVDIFGHHIVKVGAYVLGEATLIEPSYYWSGANGAQWDTETKNWFGEDYTNYSNKMKVIFSDQDPATHTSVSNTNITIVPPLVSPKSVTFNNTGPANGGVDYTINGKIDSPGPLTKNGAGRVTLTSVNSYADDAMVNVGNVLLAVPAAQLKSSKNLHVGDSDSASVTVTSGASLSNADAFIGSNSTGKGVVFISDVGSKWTSSGNLYVGGSADGAGGTGKLTVKDGASVNIADTFKIWPGGQVVLESTQTSNATPPTLTAHNLVIEPTTKKDAQLTGVGVISSPSFQTNVTNHGVIELRGDRQTIPVDALPISRSVNSVTAQIAIGGDYKQSAAGTLKIMLHPGDAQQFPTESSAINTSLLVTGTAHLDGTLQIDRQGDFVPAIGDRFDIMHYNSLDGRFKTFDPRITDSHGTVNNDEFFGLNYRKQQLQAITLAAPQGLPTPTQSVAQRNLVLITHGTDADVAPGSWVQTLASAIKNDVPSSDWDVATLDWSQYAGGRNDPETILYTPGIGKFDPLLSANNGINIGESLANWMQYQGYHYTNAHLISHSSGSWLVNSLSQALSSQTNIHLTLLDAFHPPGGIYRAGDPPDSAPPELGASATVFDHYYDSRIADAVGQIAVPVPNAGVFISQWAGGILRNAYNINVTALDPSHDDVSANNFGHSWPYFWYIQTAQSPNEQNTHGFGYAFTREFLDTGSDPALPEGLDGFVPGGNLILHAEGPDSLQTGVFMFRPVQLTEDSSVISPTGTVTFNSDGGVKLETGSPVLVTNFVNLTAPTNLLDFSFQFLTGMDSMLSVYLDGSQIYGLEQNRIPLALQGMLLPSSEINLGTIAAGMHTLLFRLDPLGVDHSSIEISGVEFGSFQAVPEPSSCMLLAFALAALVGIARRQSVLKRT